MGSWGWQNFNGVEVFLEQGRDKPAFFPEKKIPTCFCPHETNGNPMKWQNGDIGLFWWNGEGSFYQENVKVFGNEIIYTGISCLKHIIPLLKLTNYIPLHLSGFNVDNNYLSFLNRLQNEVVLSGRSVVLSGDNYIPLPKFVKKIT